VVFGDILPQGLTCELRLNWEHDLCSVRCVSFREAHGREREHRARAEGRAQEPQGKHPRTTSMAFHTSPAVRSKGSALEMISSSTSAMTAAAMFATGAIDGRAAARTYAQFRSCSNLVTPSASGGSAPSRMQAA
jgi:hypothetical protein